MDTMRLHFLLRRLATILAIAMFGLGWTAMNLEWSQLGYWRLNIELSIIESVPFIGQFLRQLLLGGDTVSTISLEHLLTYEIIVLANNCSDRSAPIARRFAKEHPDLVTAEMYAKAGGIPPVRTPEDEAFYQALLRVDARFRHSPLVQVTTSARVSGRSPVGLAAQLRRWTEMSEGSTLKVEPAAAMIDWFQSRRKLRSLWQGLAAESQLSLDSHSERLLLGQTWPYRQRVEPLADKLGLSANWLCAELRQQHTFGRLFEQVTQRQQQSYLNHWQPIDIMTAIGELRQYLATMNCYPSQR